MTEFHYTGDQSDEPESRELAPERQDLAAKWRDALIETVADIDDKIAEMYLAGETIELDVLKAAIRRATIAQKIVPVFCGAALRNRHGFGLGLVDEGGARSTAGDPDHGRQAQQIQAHGHLQAPRRFVGSKSYLRRRPRNPRAQACARLRRHVRPAPGPDRSAPRPDA
jgi:hypothetical protein